MCRNPQTYQQPDKGSQKPQDAAYVSGYLYCSTEAVDANHDLVIAAGTIVIAIFTCTLWWSTNKLWGAGERQLVELNRQVILASKEFTATHRPKLFRVVEMLSILPGDAAQWRIILTNSGESDAYENDVGVSS